MPRARCLCVWLAATTAAALLTACASKPEDDWTAQLRARGLAPGETVNSIPDFRIDGFNVLDAQHLILHTGFQRRHLITFGSPCSGLRFAERLAYRAPAGSLGRLDTLTVVGQGPTVPCVIDSIQVLKPIEDKKAG
jgi:hypothetical protein